MSRTLAILVIALTAVIASANSQQPRMGVVAPSGNGTGFFVGRSGFILTCYHVVEKAREVKVRVSTGESLAAVTVCTDPGHDLALLHVQCDAPAVVPILLDQNAALGDEVYTLGFPVPRIEGFNPKLTSGIVNSLTGARDNPDYLQISAPVQPGNSGGAVISEQGYLMGIVAGRLKETVFLRETDVLPQNINYAEKASLAGTLLESQNVVLETNGFHSKKEAIQNLEKATALILVYSFLDSSRQTHVAQEERELAIKRDIEKILSGTEDHTFSIIGNEITITSRGIDWHLLQQDSLARALACEALVSDSIEAMESAQSYVMYQFFHVIINEYRSGDVLGEAIVERSDYPTITALFEEQDRSLKIWGEEIGKEILRQAPNFIPSLPAPSYPTPAPTPTPKLTAPAPMAAPIPAPHFKNAKWPDGSMLIHPKHFVKASVINVAPDDTLELRSGFGTRFDPVTEIPPNGTDITVFDQDQRWDGDTFWYPVEWHGYRGYVAGQYISISQ
jgi:hypothetical protein